MIIVMGGIVVLFLLTVPNIIKTMGIVNDAGCDAQLKVVDAAILQYKLTHDEYPQSENELVREGFLGEHQLKCKNDQRIRVVNGVATK